MEIFPAKKNEGKKKLLVVVLSVEKQYETITLHISLFYSNYFSFFNVILIKFIF